MGFLLVISIILIILSTMMQKNLFGEHLSYQEFMVAVENKTISEIQIEQNQQTPTGTLYVTLADGTGATMAVSDVVEIERILRENEIEYFLIDVHSNTYYRLLYKSTAVINLQEYPGKFSVTHIYVIRPFQAGIYSIMLQCTMQGQGYSLRQQELV
jgi:ATP-dependent Zn protease